jgi:hypothetical protein
MKDGNFDGTPRTNISSFFFFFFFFFFFLIIKISNVRKFYESISSSKSRTACPKHVLLLGQVSLIKILLHLLMIQIWKLHGCLPKKNLNNPRL